MPNSGFILVDKPQGVTSHDVVDCVRDILHTKRVGHAGTLDPMATGLLIVGFGSATRLLNYLLGQNKTYETVIRLGEATTTDDADGDVISNEVFEDDFASSEPASGVSFRSKYFGRASVDGASADGASVDGASVDSESFDSASFIEELQSVISKHFIGSIMQVPTSYSAVKVNGKRAYELSREGQEVHLESRKIFIHDFSVLDAKVTEGVSGAKVIDVHANITCSSGTYIRALARDLGRMLGVGGHLVQLRRTNIGYFSVDDPRVLKLRAKSKEFTDKNGVLQTRLKAAPLEDFGAKCSGASCSSATCSVDKCSGAPCISHYCLTMLQVAKYVLPIVCINKSQAEDLRFGRFIELSEDAEVPNLELFSKSYLQDESQDLDLCEQACNQTQANAQTCEQTQAEVNNQTAVKYPALTYTVEEVDKTISENSNKSDICESSTNKSGNIYAYNGSSDSKSVVVDVVAIVEPSENDNCGKIKPVVVFPAEQKAGKLEAE